MRACPCAAALLELLQIGHESGALGSDVRTVGVDAVCCADGEQRRRRIQGAHSPAEFHVVDHDVVERRGTVLGRYGLMPVDVIVAALRHRGGVARVPEGNLRGKRSGFIVVYAPLPPRS